MPLTVPLTVPQLASVRGPALTTPYDLSVGFLDVLTDGAEQLELNRVLGTSLPGGDLGLVDQAAPR